MNYSVEQQNGIRAISDDFETVINRQRSRIHLIRESVLLPHLRPMERELIVMELENFVDEHEALRRENEQLS